MRLKHSNIKTSYIISKIYFLAGILIKLRPQLFTAKAEIKIPPTSRLEQQVPKQILVDISNIIRGDNKTGIQRVVRAIIEHLSKNTPIGYEVKLVFATKKFGFRYAPKDFLSTVTKSELSQANLVRCRPGDIFFGLDLNANLLPRYIAQLVHWRKKGVVMAILIYDLLPELHPDWFNEITTKQFNNWLKLITPIADRLIFISDSVIDEYKTWFQDHAINHLNSPVLRRIRLGADIEKSMPSSGIPDNTSRFLEIIGDNKKILMVGTIEPRKGQQEVLEAFNAMWSSGNSAILIYVGRKGWKTGELQKSIIEHPLLNNKLFWFENASDEFLGILYKLCDGVIVNSKGEGLGLPLIEAQYNGKPLLVRDIPVFREISNSSVTFFKNQNEKPSKIEVETWMNSFSEGEESSRFTMKNTWVNCAKDVVNALGIIANGK